jgi:hypothetical protein
MRLENLKETYDYFSGKLSDIVRQLGLAGIAIIWIFRGSSVDRPAIPRPLVTVGIFLVLGLTLDLLHYVAATMIWGVYHTKKEIEFGEGKAAKEKEFSAPRSINWVALVMFWSKTLSILLAYILLFRFLAGYVVIT